MPRGTSLLIFLEFPACPHLPPPLPLCWGLWRTVPFLSLMSVCFCLGKGDWYRGSYVGTQRRGLGDFLEEEALKLRS